MRARWQGEALVGWRPQAAFLGIVGTGDPRVSVASRGALGLEGDWLWDLKVGTGVVLGQAYTEGTGCWSSRRSGFGPP